MRNSKIISDSDALLLYRVGPVLCCSPTRCVESVVVPPSMNKPPGVDELRPGVFRHVSGIVKTVDLRVAFGVDKERRSDTGRVIIVKLETGRPGFWVDEIIDVVEFPDKGWGQLPPLIPRDIFERILLLNEKIQLYCDFDKLNTCRKSGYLRDYIERLDEVGNRIDGSKDISGVGEQHVLSSGLTTRADKDNEKPAVETELDELAYAPMTSNTNDEPVIKSTSSLDLPDSIKSSGEKTQSETRNDALANVASEKISSIEKPSSTGDDGSVTDHKQVDDFEHDVPNYTNDVDRKYWEDREHSSYQKVTQYESRLSDYDDNDSTWQISVAVMAMALLLAVAVYYLLDSDLPDKAYSIDSRIVDLDEASLSDIELPVMAEIKATSIHEPVVKEFAESDEGLSADISSKHVESDEGLSVDISSTNVESGLLNNEESHIQPERILDKAAISIEKDDQGYVIVVDHTDNQYETEDLSKIANQLPSTSAQETFISPDNMNLPLAEKPQAEDLGEKSAAMKTKEEAVQASAPENNLELVFVSTEITRSEQSDKSVSESKASKENVKRQQIIHIVVKGDTLWYIAKRYINNPYRYPELARLSNIRNPDLIYPGDRVKIIIIDRQ